MPGADQWHVGIHFVIFDDPQLAHEHAGVFQRIRQGHGLGNFIALDTGNQIKSCDELFRSDVRINRRNYFHNVSILISMSSDLNYLSHLHLSIHQSSFLSVSRFLRCFPQPCDYSITGRV